MVWIILILTLTGTAVGLIVKYLPGHAGPDPATVSLLGPPMPLYILPSLALALVLALGGLGPENPIIAIIIGLTVWIGTRFIPGVETKGWVMLAAAGTIGAMFGTPVAAALLISELVSGDEETPIWDRIFAPLVAAGAGALTTSLFEQPSFTLAVEPYSNPQLIDLVGGALVAVGAVAIGLVAVWIFPLAHKFFISLRHPVLMLTLGGFLLGILGVIGGPIRMFKGLAEMKTLAAAAPSLDALALLAIMVIITRTHATPIPSGVIAAPGAQDLRSPARGA